MTGLLLYSIALAASAVSDTVDTAMVAFPFLKQGPIYLHSLTGGLRDGGKDSVARLEGGVRHATDSTVYQKLIPLRIEVAGRSDSGTAYRMSYIGYRENPGFKYMWNSSTFRYRYSHRLDYETEPIQDEKVVRTVFMTRNLTVRDSVDAMFFSVDLGLGGKSINRINLMELYESYWGGKVYVGSSILTLAFLNELGGWRISGNGLIFMAASVAYVLQTQPGGYWPLNPGGLFGPVAYSIFLLHAAPNAHVVVPVFGDGLSLRAGMNTDYFLKGSPDKIAFGVDGGVRLRYKRANLYVGVIDQRATPAGEATGFRYALSLGVGGIETEYRPYFR